MAINLIDRLRFAVNRAELEEALILIRDVAGAAANLRVEKNIIKWSEYDINGVEQQKEFAVSSSAAVETGEEIVELLSNLPDADKLSYNDLKDTPEDFANLPKGESTPVKYKPSVIYHDPNRIAGNHLVPLNDVIKQVEANNTLYTTRQTGSFVTAANFNTLTVETVTYGTISAKALVITYNGNLFNEQQLIKFEIIDSTGELTKEFVFPTETIRNGFDYVVSDALANSSIHKKEVRFRIVYDSTTNKTKIYVHQRPVSDPPPSLYLFIVALQNVEVNTIKGEDGAPGRDGVGGGIDSGRAFPLNPVNDQEFILLEDLTNYKSGFYFYNTSASDWKLVTKGDGVVPVPADGSITKQKLAQAVLDLINSKEFTGYFNRTRIYKRGEIFDIQGTFIQVISTTWQASVDSPTFADNAWRNLLDNSAHRSSVRALTFTGAVFDVNIVNGKLVVDFEDGRQDKELTLPSGGGGENFSDLELASTLEDDDQLILNDFSGSGGGVTLTSGVVFSSSGLDDYFGWSVAAGSDPTKYKKGGSLSVVPNTDLISIASNQFGNVDIAVKTGTLTTLGSIVINNISYPLTLQASDVASTSGWLSNVNYDSYRARNVPVNVFSPANSEHSVSILNKDGSVVLGGTPRSATKKKVTWGKLKGDIGSGTNFADLELATTLEDDDELVLNDFSGEDSSNPTLTVGLFPDNSRYGFVNASLSHTVNSDIGSFDVAYPETLALIQTEFNQVAVIVKGGTKSISQIIIDDDVRSLSLAFSGNNGNGGADFNDIDYYSSATDTSGPDFVRNGTYKIKILHTDGTVYFAGATVRSATKKKATWGQLKLDIGSGENFEDLEAASTLEDDDELVLNDFSGGGKAILTAGEIEGGQFPTIGWSKDALSPRIASVAGTLSAGIIDDNISSINTRDGDLFIIITQGALSGIGGGSIIVDGEIWRIYSTPSNSGGYSRYEAFKSGSEINMVSGQSYEIKVLLTDGTVVVDGGTRSAQKKKVTWAKLKGDIDVSTNFAELETVTTLEDDDELVLNDFSGGGTVALTAENVLHNNRYGWSVAGSGSTFKKGGEFSEDPPSGLISIFDNGNGVQVYVKSGTLQNIGSVVIDGVNYPITKGSTVSAGWISGNADIFSKSSNFAFVDGQEYQIKILATDGTTIFPSEQRVGEQKKGTLGQLKQNILQLVPRKAQTILTPEYLKARPNLARDEIRIDSTGTGTLGIGTDTFVDTDLPSTAYQAISIAVLKTDIVDAKYIEVFHAHAPQVLAASSGLRELSDFDDTAKPFSGTFRSDRNYTMEIHRSQNQLGTVSTTTDRITFTANTTGGAVYIGEIRIWK